MRTNRVFRFTFFLALLGMLVIGLSGCTNSENAQEETTGEIKEVVTSPTLESDPTLEVVEAPSVPTPPSIPEVTAGSPETPSNEISPSEEVVATPVPATPAPAQTPSAVVGSGLDDQASRMAADYEGVSFNNNGCARFVSTGLGKLGLTTGVAPAVSGLRDKLIDEGWKSTSGEFQTGQVLISKGSGVSHAAMIFKDPQTGETMVVHHPTGERGVETVPYSKYRTYFPAGVTTRLTPN
jgi:hypothetical protein